MFLFVKVNDCCDKLKKNTTRTKMVKHFRCHFSKYKNIKNQSLKSRKKIFGKTKFILISFQSFIHYYPPSLARWHILNISDTKQDSRHGKGKKEKQFIPFYENKVQVKSFLFWIKFVLKLFFFTEGESENVRFHRNCFKTSDVKKSEFFTKIEYF